MFDVVRHLEELRSWPTDRLVARRAELVCVQRQAHIEELDVLRVLDERGRIDVSVGDNGESARTLRVKVETARALESLPAVAAAAYAGELSVEQLGSVVILADESSDAEWARRAPHVSPVDLARLARNASKPSVEDAQARFAARSLRMWWTGEQAMLHVHGQFPDVMGAKVEAAIQRITGGMKPPKGQVWDSFEHRAADALASLCEPQQSDNDMASLAAKPLIVVQVPVKGPAEIGGIPPADAVVEKLRANANIEPVLVDDDGTVISVGKQSTVLSPKVMRAVLLRDGHCRCGNCDVRHALQIHHLRPRSWGGTDEISNLAAVCIPAGHHQMLIPTGPWCLVGNPNQPDGLELVHLDNLNHEQAEQLGRPPKTSRARSSMTASRTIRTMTPTLVATGYGRASAQALRDAVAAGKHGDPLAPVTVVVPTNYVGFAGRRLLAAGTLGQLTEAGHGVAGVTFLTTYRLAELLGAPRLAGAHRRPVSTPVLAAAVRAVLAQAAGVFSGVAEHPSTEAALVEAYRELAACDTDALDALARTSRRAGDVVRICRAARVALSPDWYDERDLMDAASVVVGDGSPVLDDLGAVVVHLPQEISVPASRMLLALALRVPVAVIGGFTGVARADAGVRRSLDRLGLEHSADDPTTMTPSHATRVVSVSDPDDELRAAVRMVFAALRDDVPLERMAILYGAKEPYARLVHEQLTAAGIPHNGAAVRTLAESVLGRSLLGLLALPDRGFHRHDVMSLLASAPVYHRGEAVPAARWERISRTAGVVRGPQQWQERLGRHARVLERSVAEERDVPDRDPHPEHYERELGATRALQEFVADLVAALAVERGRGWREIASWTEALVRDFLAPDPRRAGWPEQERLAAEKVEAALERLAGLDAVEESPGLDVFRRTLELELDADLGRVGRLGDGLLMGHVALGLGLDLDRVFVCGLAEGTFPGRIRDDSLLPDAERRATRGILPLRSSRVDDDHRRFLAVLAGATQERVLLYPRGDLRRTTERMPSRFLLESVTALGGERRAADDLADLSADWYSPVPSFAAGIARVTFPATEQEHRLRSLLDHTRAGHRVAAHDLIATDVALRRGIDATTARAGGAFTRFDGNLAGLDVGRPTDPAVVVSPTRLQTWAACPFAYLMDQVLRVDVPELPEERYELSPLDRGNIVHETLDTFLREVLQRPGGPPTPDTPWSDTDRARLREVADAVCASYEAQGLTGRRLFWRRDRRRILADLDRFLTEDTDLRATQRMETIATELRFGFRAGSAPPVELELSDGRVLRFRGAADRVDRLEHDALWVIDYKTGKPYGIDPADPTARGTMLQLPVYAHAARASFGDAFTPVGASYWYISTKGGFRWAELVLSPAVETRVDDVLRAITDGIDAGVFPCRVDAPSTWTRRDRSYADPDARGTRDRYREWQRKRDAPELRGYVALAEPEPGPEPDLVGEMGDDGH